MTELTIIPKISDKTARFKGTVAAGEHVAVIIKGGAAWIDNEDAGAHLSLRVLDLVTGRTLAVFPRPPETLLEGELFAEGENEWAPSEENPEDLYCELNLNTVPMVAAARHMLRVPVLFVLGEKDDEDASVVRTLYFRDRHIVEFWPERVGDDTPYDLDKWPRQIDEWTDLITEWTEQFSRMKIEATPTENGMSVTVWDGTGEEPEPVEIKNGQDGEPGEMTEAMTDARIALLAAPISHVSDTNLHLQSGERAAWTAKQDAIADLSTIRSGASAGATAVQPADLFSDDKIKPSLLPSYVDDVLEYANLASFPATGETGKIYVAKDTNKTYRWSGSQYIEISPAPDLSNYVQKESGKGLSTNDFTTAEKEKLAGIAAGAQVNVIETVKVNGTALTPSSKAVNIEIVQSQADWNETSSSSSSFIKNKPTVPEPLPVYGDSPLMDGTASAGTGTAYALGDHRHPTDTSRQASITASGILKGNGAGGVTAAVAGTDYQSPLTIDATPTASSTNPVQSGGVKTALDGKLSTTGDTRTVTATDSGGTEAYKFAGTGETTDDNVIVRVSGLPYVNVGEAAQMLVGVYGILSRGVQRHTATSGETSATFGFADTPGTGKIADAILEIDNSGNTSALGLEFYGLGTTFTLVAPDGEDLAEMTSVDGGKQARFYFTETALVSNNLPVVSIQRITLGAVATSITRGS